MAPGPRTGAQPSEATSPLAYDEYLTAARLVHAEVVALLRAHPASREEFGAPLEEARAESTAFDKRFVVGRLGTYAEPLAAAANTKLAAHPWRTSGLRVRFGSLIDPGTKSGRAPYDLVLTLTATLADQAWTFRYPINVKYTRGDNNDNTVGAKGTLACFGLGGAANKMEAQQRIVDAVLGAEIAMVDYLFWIFEKDDVDRFAFNRAGMATLLTLAPEERHFAGSQTWPHLQVPYFEAMASFADELDGGWRPNLTDQRRDLCRWIVGSITEHMVAAVGAGLAQMNALDVDHPPPDA